jgi:hypothetical protein
VAARLTGGPDRSAGIYAAVISELIAGGHANFDPWPPVTYIDATARSSAGPVAVSDVVTSPIPIEVQHRIGEALAAHTEVRFVDDPQSVIQPDSRVRDVLNGGGAGSGGGRESNPPALQRSAHQF